MGYERRFGYTLAEELGKGSFGEVRRAIAADGKIVAIKIIELDTFVQISDVSTELTLMRTLNHPNIVQVYESHLVDTSLWICMEFCSAGSLWTMLRTFKRLSEEESRYVICETLKGLAFMHSQNILHRDIKSANILVTSKGKVKLADFGVGTQLARTMEERRSFMGTTFWMAPEVIQGSQYGKPVDIWSIGIFAIELICGRTPHSHLAASKAMSVIVNQDPPSLRCILRNTKLVSEAYYSFSEICLQRDPKNRSTAKSLLEHPALANCSDAPDAFLSKVRFLTDRGAIKSAAYQRTNVSVSSPKQDENSSSGDYWSLGPKTSGGCAAKADPGAAKGQGQAPQINGQPVQKAKADGETGNSKSKYLVADINDPKVLGVTFSKLIVNPLVRTAERARNPEIRQKIIAISESLADLGRSLPGFSYTLVEETSFALRRYNN